MERSPRPLANIIDEVQTYSTKKERLDTGLSLKAPSVPKPPSRLTYTYALQSQEKAKSISFRENSSSNLSISYRSDDDQTYFLQCFKEISKIGEGDFGVVFKAKSVDDDRFYAVKKSKHRFTSDNDKRTKLEEVRKHESVPKNSYCIQFYRAWMENDHLFLQLELCATTLEKFAATNHSIPEPQIWRILLDMLMALKNLHDANLIHLDIKLDNIMMTSSGTCKLGDFGLLIDLNQNSPDDWCEGDSKYIAPELLKGDFSKAADVYSLGIAMLELSCDLILPGNGVLWHELRSNKFPTCLANSASAELVDIIKRMMHSDAQCRPSVDALLQTPKLRRMYLQRSFFRQIQNIILGRLDFMMLVLVWLYKLPSWFINLGLQSRMMAMQRAGEVTKTDAAMTLVTPKAKSTPSVFRRGWRMRDVLNTEMLNSPEPLPMEAISEKPALPDSNRKRRYDCSSPPLIVISSKPPCKSSRMRPGTVGRKLFKLDWE